MKLRELTLGPIVGETTPQRTRIWGRGDAHIIEDAPRRCFGAIRYRKSGTKQWQKHQIIKMNPNFDLTGVAILDGLESETRYDYQFGYFFRMRKWVMPTFQNLIGQTPALAIF